METVNRRVLMIDDDREDFILTRQMLEQARGVKFDLSWEATFASGMEQIEQDHYDAVLVDYDLGAKTGLDIIRQASANGYSAPFILFTGRGNYQVDTEAMNAGATMYLAKGEVNPLLLERTIRYAIEIKQKEHALRASETQLQEMNVQLERELVERKRAERIIAAEQAWFRITLASIGDAVITTDPQGCVTSLNSVAEDLTGWSTSQALGQPFEQVFSIINESTHQKVADPVGQVIRSGLVVGLAGNTALVARDGKVIPVEDSAAPIQDGDGQVLGVVMVFRDVTEKRKIELALKGYGERLKQSNQELEDFAFIASHDLQEPLRKVKQFGELLNDRLETGQGQEPGVYLDQMNNAITRMQAMIEDLLKLSQIQCNEENFVKVDLSEAAFEVVGDLETRLRDTQGQVIIEPLPTIEGDPIQMRQLLQNLIGNALKYHKPEVPPLVKVSVRTDPARSELARMVSIQVEDNGIGFDETEVERIFQPFQRLHGRSEYEGSGIGLAICKKIVERHRGQIAVHSRPGEGSTFIITLPVRV